MSELVLVTGISGFIAKHVALNLLQCGYSVRGTLRTPKRADEVRQALQTHSADTSGLSFVEADLGSDSGWAEAASGCTYVQHVASPFPIKQPRHREALVPEARQGALRVLEAARAADVKRIVFTSSMASMIHRANRPKQMTVTEDDWTDPTLNRLSPYIVSKTRAERAAWDWARENGWERRLTVINPGFVLGPTLDGQTCTSLDVIKLFMKAAYPAVPPAVYPVVDVRDLAELHVRAMTAPDAGGRRLIAAADTLSMPQGHVVHAPDGRHSAQRVSGLCQEDPHAHLARFLGAVACELRSCPEVRCPGHWCRTGCGQCFCDRINGRRVQAG
jgi:dihydroflavonol-4-reductase